MLAEIAAGLGVDREDLDFADVTYYQGSEFLIENEFDAGYAQLSSVRSELACAFSTRLLSVQGCFGSTFSTVPDPVLTFLTAG